MQTAQSQTARLTKRFDELFTLVLLEEAEKMKLYNEENKEELIKPLKKFLDDSIINQAKPKEKSNNHSEKKSLVLKKKSSFTEEKSKSISKKSLLKSDPIKIDTNKKAGWLDETLNHMPTNKIFIKIQSPHSNACGFFFAKSRIFLQKSSDIVAKTNLGGLTINAVIKSFCPVLMEILKRLQKYNRNTNENTILSPFFYIFYEFLFNRHALSRENTENRLFKLIQSSFFHKKVPRIRNFLSLLGLSENDSSDGFDLIFYLESLQKLDDTIVEGAGLEESKANIIPGISLLLSAKEATFVGLNKAIDHLSQYFKKMLGWDNKIRFKLEDMINRLKNQKVTDPLVSRKFVIDVDLVIEMLFAIKNEAYQGFKEIFLMLDVYDREALGIEEFLLIMKHVEPNNVKGILDIFEGESDYINEGKQSCMSLRRFGYVCERNSWLSNSKIEKFLKNIKDDILDVHGLKKEWEVKKRLIKLKFIKTNMYTSFYNRILKRVDVLIKNNNQSSSAWFLYRLIDEEANKILIEFESENLLARELILLKNIFKE